MPKLRHFDDQNTVRAINFSCYKRMRLLKRDIDRQSVVEAIEAVRTKYQFKLLGYVIMPSHVHLVIHPAEDSSVGKIIAEIKSRSAKDILKRWKARKYQMLDYLLRETGKYSFWQKRCYDHNCRTIEAAREKINYCHNNPVRAGLAKTPGDWQWSSYRWYQGDTSGPLSIDEIDLI